MEWQRLLTDLLNTITWAVEWEMRIKCFGGIFALGKWISASEIIEKESERKNCPAPSKLACVILFKLEKR